MKLGPKFYMLRVLASFFELCKYGSSPPRTAAQFKLQLKHASLLNRSELSNKTLVFHLEGALLKSSCLFPYFMLVAFEAGGLLRALVLFLLYPLILVAGKEIGMKIMVFVSFFGVKKDKFRIGVNVLPKFLLEDVGDEGFDVVMSSERKIAVSDMPRVMVEEFLRNYLGIKDVSGRELKVVNGYFVGLMEEESEKTQVDAGPLHGESSQAIWFGCYNNSFHHSDKLFPHCKEIYLVTEEEKRNWRSLPRAKYPKPLIFHDGRLAFRPTPQAALVMFMWLPLGFFLYIIRFISGILLPYKLQIPILAGVGNITTTSSRNSVTSNERETEGGKLYVCNHRTLLDPLIVSLIKMAPITAVTYSVSKINEAISPIKTVGLTRDRENDRKTMETMLKRGNLVVCPEGTTCREPYLLRFSPLFAEITDEIEPIALNLQVSMFYGTTASGNKLLDPMFHLMNPNPTYNAKILDKLPSSWTCKAGGKSSSEVANHVQNMISEANGFECTNLTRKDKYMILAGNKGIV